MSLGRKTAYSFKGIGFPWGSVLKPAQNGRILSIFVIPRMLYGLDNQSLKKKDIVKGYVH